MWAALAVGVLLLAFVLLLAYMRPAVDGQALTFTEFIDLANAGRIEGAEVLDEDAYVVGDYVREDGSVAAYNTPLVRGTQRDILQTLADNRVPTSIEQQAGKRIAQLGAILLPGLILVVLFVYLILSFRRGTGLFGLQSGARKVEASDSPVTFADVAGQDGAVAELKEITDFLADPERFTELGAVVPKGVLLYGPPGCGKTLLARALAGEAGASFYSISGSDFVELYVGVGASRVRELFTQARENAPAIVFIDELDSVGRARGAGGGGAAAAVHSEQEQALNQILAEMDGFSPSEGLIVVAATNRPDILDPALLRPGRFDRSVGLERPDELARLAILSLHVRGKRLADDVDLAAITRQAIGLTGADLASVANEAALLAARAGKAAVSQHELEDALQRILAAPERQRRLSLRDRSVGRRFTGEERVTFADVAGMDEAADELAEIREYLTDPERFAALGARVPRGILLSGPPGCGKTLLARAVAGESNAAFLSVAASEFVEVYVGQGAARVRDLFAEAKTMAPAIVFLDEIDAVGGHRGMSAGGHGEREQTLNQILTELDGFEPAAAVIVMAATNRPDILDAALVRPGRFDRHVAVGLPDRAGRRAILDLHASGKPLADDVDLDVVAGLTRGYAGADLANVLNEAALLAAREGLAAVPMRLVEEGIERASMGLASGVVMSEEERRTIAYHEAGHALVSRVLPGATPLHKLTILARGGSLGHCRVLDDVDRVVRSRSMLLDQMAVGLGGRVAEELVFGEPSTGAGSDLERVGAIARAMVCGEAMGEGVGLLPLAGVEDQHGGRGYSQETGRALEAEMCRLMEEAQGRARGALTAAGVELDRVAEALLTRETLTAADLDELAAESAVVEGPEGEEPAQPLSRPTR